MRENTEKPVVNTARLPSNLWVFMLSNILLDFSVFCLIRSDTAAANNSQSDL